MKGEKVADTLKTTLSSSKMSDFFRHGSVEEKRAIYAAAARIAINEQRDVIDAACAEGSIKN